MCTDLLYHCTFGDEAHMSVFNFYADRPAQEGDSCVWWASRVSGYVIHVTHSRTTRSISPRNMVTNLLVTHRNFNINDHFRCWTLQGRIRDWQCLNPVVRQGWMALLQTASNQLARIRYDTHSVNATHSYYTVRHSLRPRTARARSYSIITPRANGEFGFTLHYD